MRFAQEPVHPLDAEIVAAPLEQGHRRGVGERAGNGREIPIEELFLQILEPVLITTRLPDSSAGTR